jgi:O-antigen/teichoic acid export membrane protein
MAHSELKHKTAKGLFWGGFSNGLQQILVLVFGIYFARKLNDTHYGIYAELTIFVAIAQTIINSGFSILLINKRDAKQKDYDAVFWFSFLTGLSLYIILYFCAPFISGFFNQPELVDLSRFVFLSFLIASIGVVPSAIVMKKMMTKQIAIISLVSLLISACTGLIMVNSGYTYWAIGVQNTLSYVIPSIVYFFMVPWKPHFTFDFSPLKKMFPFCIRIFFTNIVVQINSYIFNVLFGKIYNAEEVGNYYQGQKWMITGQSVISGMINYITQPVLSTINEDSERQINALRKMLRFGAFVSFPLLLGLAFVGKEFIVVTITDKWLSAVPYLQILCVWGASMFLSTIFTNLIYAREKSGIYLKITIIIACLQLSAIASMACFGRLAMVIGYVSANYIGLAIWHHYVKKIIGLRLRDVLKDVLPYLGLTIICFAVTWLITFKIENLILLLISKVVISAFLYIIALRLTNSVMFRESADFLLSGFKKIFRN